MIYYWNIETERYPEDDTEEDTHVTVVHSLHSPHVRGHINWEKTYANIIASFPIKVNKIVPDEPRPRVKNHGPNHTQIYKRYGKKK